MRGVAQFGEENPRMAFIWASATSFVGASQIESSSEAFSTCLQCEFFPASVGACEAVGIVAVSCPPPQLALQFVSLFSSG